VRLTVIVVGIRVKLGAVVVRGLRVVILDGDVRVVRQRVQHGHAGRDEVRDQRKASDPKPPTERATMHRHAPKVACLELMRQLAAGKYPSRWAAAQHPVRIAATVRSALALTGTPGGGALTLLAEAFVPPRSPRPASRPQAPR
jgi:hypothetical protein